MFMCYGEVKEQKRLRKRKQLIKEVLGGKGRTSIEDLSGQFGSVRTKRKREAACGGLNEDAPTFPPNPR